MAVRRFQAALTPAQVNANTSVEQSFPVGPGDLNLAATVIVTKPTSQTGLLCLPSARVVSATNIGVIFSNPTAGNITPTAGEVYQFAVID